MCRRVCFRAYRESNGFYAFESVPLSLEPLIFGFLILAGRFGFAIYFGRRPDNREGKLPFPITGRGVLLSQYFFISAVAAAGRSCRRRPRFVDAERDVAVHPDQEGRLLDPLHYAVNTAGRDDGRLS